MPHNLDLEDLQAYQVDEDFATTASFRDKQILESVKKPKKNLKEDEKTSR